MKTVPFAILCVAALAACSSADEVAEDLGQGTDGAAQTGQEPVGTNAACAGFDAMMSETEDFSFGYTPPQVGGNLDSLQRHFCDESRAALDAIAKAAREERAAAEAGDFPFRPHGYAKEWTVVAQLPDWLSLNAEIALYSGGAHGNVAYDSLVWSKTGDFGLDPLEFFRSPGNLERAVRRRYCEELNGERARRRGELVPQDSEDMFDQCPKLEELTVLLGSSNGREFNRIGLIAAPYVAGPYAEGTYEVTLPVDSSVLDAAKPELVRYFALGR